ncbi:MAG: hypothetical protein EAZ85_07475 [Bacteroidetes bacterium]|nr:MAG: hypothetical protein EAZ85_07475 [Bacteroidota bacterium]
MTENQQISKISLTGKDNIALANIVNSTITINDTQELEQLLKNLVGINQTLKIMVLVSTKQDFESMNKDEDCFPDFRYGDKPENWEVFSNQPILEVLLEFKNLSKLDLDIVFVNRWQLDKKQKAYIKANICDDTILIIDLFSLIFQENKNFANIFDCAEIGGLLAPICEILETYRKTYHKDLQNTFEYVDCFWKEHFNREYMFIDLAIPNKHLLFRRLADIAFKHLALKPQQIKNIDEGLARKEQSSENY